MSGHVRTLSTTRSRAWVAGAKSAVVHRFGNLGTGQAQAHCLQMNLVGHWQSSGTKSSNLACARKQLDTNTKLQTAGS